MTQLENYPFGVSRHLRWQRQVGLKIQLFFKMKMNGLIFLLITLVLVFLLLCKEESNIFEDILPI